MISKVVRLTNAAPIASIPAPKRGFILTLACSRHAGTTEEATVEVRKSNFVSGDRSDELLRQVAELATGNAGGSYTNEYPGLGIGGPTPIPNQGIPFALLDSDTNLYIRATSATSPWTIDVRIILAPVIYP